MNMFYRKVYCLVLICIICSGIVNGQSSLTTIAQLNSLLDDVVFKSLLEVDIQKAEVVQLSNKQCFIPMNNYIEKNIFGKGKTIILDGDKIKEFVVHKIKTGVRRKELSKSLLASLKKGTFTVNDQTPAKLSDEK